MSAQDERWQLDHQRKLITVRAGWPDDAAPEAERRIHGLVGWLADPAGQVDVSDYELAVLGHVDSTDVVRAALAALVAGGQLSIEPGPEGAQPGIGQFMCECPQCHEMLSSVHRRALELNMSDHMAGQHGQPGVSFDLDPRRGKTLH